ncbi:MAG: MFS transporter [Paracoccaceae bacterium]
MRIGLVVLCAAYMLSQFFRAFLAVLAQVLGTEIGAGAEDLAVASSMWFLTFAAMQIPIGWALDTLGPRRTASMLLGLGGAGGAAVFALATAPWHVNLAMGMIGVGCAPVLMASYYIFARSYPAAMFATLGAVMVGTGTLGNLAGSAPLAWAVAAVGWRASLWGMAAVTLLVALLIWRIVEDPPLADRQAGGSLWTLLKMPALWPLLPLMVVAYAPSGGLRGLWIGSYLGDIYGADGVMLGNATLIMGAAMVAGTFFYGPLDRWVGSKKWVVFAGMSLVLAALVLLWVDPVRGVWVSVALFAAIGFFGAVYPVMMAHGRGLFPDHLVGRGVTFLNLCSIGGVGVMQLVTGRVFVAAEAQGERVDGAYSAVFLIFALTVLIGLSVYVFARDRAE